MLQANTRIESGQEMKYVVGQRLRFVGFNPEEQRYGSCLHRGDILQVLAANNCGMGIDVKRLSDGYIDMVWPEEVSVIAQMVLPL